MLKGKVALVTGACGDIGAAILKLFIRNGAKVIANDVLDPAAAADILKTIGDLVESVRYVQADVTSPSEVKALVSEATQRFGHLDICVANAGVVAPAPFLDISPEDWFKQIDVNLNGCFYVAQESACLMIEQGIAGKVVFTSSWVQDVPSKNLAAYCASKGGLQMLAKCMALELAPHAINVNLVAPGNVDAGLSAQMFRVNPELRDKCVRMVPLGYIMTAEQVAEGVLFLCSSAADYMTGSTLLMDGGNSLFQRD